MINETDWINIARVGTWTDKNGNIVDLTPERLDTIIASYNPKEREAPLVLGHPATDDPAYGWVLGLRRKGELLQAKFRRVMESIRNIVDNGNYRKVSMSLFPDGRTLKHVGLLGATQPAIPGLGDIRFEADFNDITMEFSVDQSNCNPGEELYQFEDGDDSLFGLTKYV